MGIRVSYIFIMLVLLLNTLEVGSLEKESCESTNLIHASSEYQSDRHSRNDDSCPYDRNHQGHMCHLGHCFFAIVNSVYVEFFRNSQQVTGQYLSSVQDGITLELYRPPIA